MLPEVFSILKHSDSRGELSFCNSFDFSCFKRFYTIAPNHSNQIRAWQGHRFEEKAIFPLAGIIKLVLIPIRDFETKITGDPIVFFLDASSPELIKVPGGFANGFQFLSKESKLMVFSNFSLEESKADDFRFQWNEFYDWNDEGN